MGGMLLMGRGADLLQGCYKANTVMIYDNIVTNLLC